MCCECLCAVSAYVLCVPMYCVCLCAVSAYVLCVPIHKCMEVCMYSAPSSPSGWPSREAPVPL